MKNVKNTMILVFAFIGLCAVLYGSWKLYQHKVSDDQARAFLSTRPANGLPDLSRDAPPPPQP